MDVKFLTVKELASKWNITDRTVRVMCSNGKIEGAIKVGRDWLIPNDAVRPKDGRIKTGKYIACRSIKKKENI